MNNVSILWPVLTTTIGFGGWILGTKFRRGSLLSPFSVTVLLLVSIFGIRPVLMANASSFNFYGLDVSGGYGAATIIGFVAVVVYLIGYFLGSTRHANRVNLLHDKKPEIVQTASRANNFMPALAITAALGVLGLWFVAMVTLGGGIAYIAELFAGRSASVGETLVGVPAVVMALPVVAALIVALTRWNSEKLFRYSFRQSLGYWAVAAFCVIPPSALGTRRFIIPSVVAVLIGAAGSTWFKRVKIRWIVLAVVAFLVLAIFPFVRSAGSRTGDTSLTGAMSEYFGTAGVEGVLNNFFLSYDTEMFNYVAYLAPRLGDSISFGFGRGTLVEAILAPIPASSLPFPTWSNQLLIQIFGGTCADAACPVPSVVGALYYDLGFPGIFGGMLVLGLLSAAFEARLHSARGLGTGLLITTGAFATVIVRGNPISQIWIALQCWILLFVADWVIRRIAQSRSSNMPSSDEVALAKSLRLHAARYPTRDLNRRHEFGRALPGVDRSEGNDRP